MSNYHVITHDRHANKRWQRASTFLFTANDALTPLTIAELPKACVSLPIGFIEQDEVFIPVAVLGLQSGKNLVLTPDGRFVGCYISAAIRSYPFRLAQTPDGRRVLCIDEDSGLVTDGLVGESFFAEDGQQPAQSVLDILSFLTQIEKDRQTTVVACAALQKHKLIRPWTITVKADTGEQQLTGLFQVDESALNMLSEAALFDVRQAGALILAYCQLLSMQHLPKFSKLVEAHAEVEMRRREHAATGLEGFRLSQDSELLKFSL